VIADARVGTSIAYEQGIRFAIERRVLVRERSVKRELAASSAPMRAALDTLLRAACSMAPLLLRGELGSEVRHLAQLVHDNSPCRNRRLVCISCPAIVELRWDDLVAGRGGTIFFDQVGALIPALQKRLAGMLDRMASPEGNMRVICSTVGDLAEEIPSGQFREDLFFRLNVVEVRIPPLRERRDEILPLATRFVATISAELGRTAPALSVDAAIALMSHKWPGNERELRNVVEHALLTSTADVLEPAALAL
jgi:DNA-binding NtrC family response regulator